MNNEHVADRYLRFSVCTRLISLRRCTCKALRKISSRNIERGILFIWANIIGKFRNCFLRNSHFDSSEIWTMFLCILGCSFFHSFLIMNNEQFPTSVHCITVPCLWRTLKGKRIYANCSFLAFFRPTYSPSSRSSFRGKSRCVG